MAAKTSRICRSRISGSAGLNLAVDKQAILKDYLKGEGVLLGYPYPPTKAYEKYFTPLDQLPPDTQELFTGDDPAKAKQLLADAGDPNGFKTKIQGQQAQADDMAMIQGVSGQSRRRHADPDPRSGSVQLDGRGQLAGRDVVRPGQGRLGAGTRC